ncbi:class I SAM-dependent methyltransferase [Wohlfahrtiimonas populi]|uniref:class I SAM-dependent methyltransferase n=1 Tax=Wohlfahrtiimonas populi TaxID=1940240 RepID=UPI00098D53AC|nr:class I SAM-dependent methyltransferase [Wohlfahrtiimonas populi]
MYIVSGKGSVAGADLSKYIISKCQSTGILWDDDLPEYTLDFLSQLPSVSMSIRNKDVNFLTSLIQQKVNESNYSSYMLLCYTAHKLIPNIKTNSNCVNLVQISNEHLDQMGGPIAFLGTAESLSEGRSDLILLDDHVELLGDLITSVKRGYANLGIDYVAHPKKILEKIVTLYQKKNINKFFLACTDLHECKKYLIDLGITEKNIVDIIEIAGDEVIKRCKKQHDIVFYDQVSDAKTYFRYKYLAASDSPMVDKKNASLEVILDQLPVISSNSINLLDIGGSSSGHALNVTKRFLSKNFHITVQDISQASLDEAKKFYKNHLINDIDFICGNISEFESNKTFDVILCLGVLIYISSDKLFEQVVKKIAELLNHGGCLITRDGLHQREDKSYMSFGGVIRNSSYYQHIFEKHGLSLYKEDNFIIDKPIYRDVKTIIWTKR